MMRAKTPWLLLAPMLITLAAVAAWPLARTIWFSLTDAGLADLADASFVGFENYLVYRDGDWEGVLTDSQWWRAVRNTLWFVAISVSLETLLGLAVALLLMARFSGRPLLQAAVLVPWAIPTIISAKMWGWIFHDQFGLLNDVLLRLGLVAEPLAWTADPDLMMAAVIVADVWKTTPFMALLLLAALQTLPRDCYQAARLDGVHPVEVFFRVTLPLIQPALVVAVIFRSLDALRIFDLIYVLTPNSEYTMSMSIYARQQLVDFQDVGYGSAASTLLFLTIGLCTVVFLAMTSRNGREEGSK